MDETNFLTLRSSTQALPPTLTSPPSKHSWTMRAGNARTTRTALPRLAFLLLSVAPFTGRWLRLLHTLPTGSRVGLTRTGRSGVRCSTCTLRCFKQQSSGLQRCVFEPAPGLCFLLSVPLVALRTPRRVFGALAPLSSALQLWWWFYAVCGIACLSELCKPVKVQAFSLPCPQFSPLICQAKQ